MPATIAVGSEAPNFDLSSTENCILMLRDEVARTAVVLYFFPDAEQDSVRNDLQALSHVRDDLARRHSKALAISPLKVDALTALQFELGLHFPLLSDDRNLAAAYGFTAAAEGESATPLVVVVDRTQKVLHTASGPGLAEKLPQILALLDKLPSSTQNYSKKVVNRLIDRWVN
jgi:peroxiredoxin